MCPRPYTHTHTHTHTHRYFLDIYCNASQPAIREGTAALFGKMITEKLRGPKVKITLSKFLPVIFMDAMQVTQTVLHNCLSLRAHNNCLFSAAVGASMHSACAPCHPLLSPPVLSLHLTVATCPHMAMCTLMRSKVDGDSTTDCVCATWH
jgi:hypothetical protein